MPTWLIRWLIRAAVQSMNPRDGALDYAGELCTLVIVSIFPQSLLGFFHRKPGTVAVRLLGIGQAPHLTKVSAYYERLRHRATSIPPIALPARGISDEGRLFYTAMHSCFLEGFNRGGLGVS
jgi:hypothetical protein